MASPLYNALSVQHSRNIGDAVAAAATNGASISSVQRDTHLNNAIKRFIRHKYLTKDFDCVNQYINEPAGSAMTGNTLSLALTPAVAWIIDVKNTTGTVQFVKQIPQELEVYLSSNVTSPSFLLPSATNQYWIRQGTVVKVLGSGATDTIVLRYIAKHTDLTADFASDILIDSQYFDILLEMALQEYLSEYPSEVNTVKLRSSIERLQMLLGK